MAHAITLPTFDASSLAKLARSSGLKIDEADLEQLVRRRIVTPIDDMFVAPHLFVLALYVDSVRVIRHPWGPKSGDVGLKDVREANDRLMKVLEEGSAEDTADFVLEMERYLAGLDPFGPFAGVVDMLGDDAAASFRGDGRLYVELRRTATRLAAKAEEAAQDDPATRELSLEDEADDDPRATADLSQADVLAGLHTRDEPGGEDESQAARASSEGDEHEASRAGASGDEESGAMEPVDDESAAEHSDNEEADAEASGSEVSDAEESGDEESGDEESDAEESGSEVSDAEESGDEESDAEESGDEQSDAEESGDEESAAEHSDAEHSEDQLSRPEESEAEESDDEDSDEEEPEEESAAEHSDDEESAAEHSDGEESETEELDTDQPDYALQEEIATAEQHAPTEAEAASEVLEGGESTTDAPNPDRTDGLTPAEPTVILDDPNESASDDDEPEENAGSSSESELTHESDDADEDEEAIPGPVVDPEELISTTEMDAITRAENDEPEGLDESTAGSDAEAEELAASEADRDPHQRETPVAPLEAAKPDAAKPDADEPEPGESLRDRLARLRKNSAEEAEEDSEDDSPSPNPPEKPSKPPGPPKPPPTREVPEAEEEDIGDSPEVIARKVSELNRLREQYIADKNWEGLAELYEDRIGLFETPAERQQIYLTLATVYDVKLDRAEEAMTSYAAAINEGASDGMKRALSGLNKVGKRDGNRGAYLEWLESALESETLQPFRPTLRKRHAIVLGLEGETTRAFMSLAAALTAHPEQLIDVDALDNLDEWAAIAELEDELDAFFDDIIDEPMPDAARRLVAQRAGLHHVAKSQPMRAIRFFRIVLQVQPDNEMAFGNLSRLYQDEDNYSDLVRLIEAKLSSTEDADEIERLQNELANAVEQELSQEDSVELYEQMLERSPDNPVIADRLVRAHLMREQYAQAYGLLNRFVDTANTPDQQLNVHLRLAEIASNHLHAPEEALVHYEDALAVDNDPRALQGIAHLKFEAEDWPGVVEAIDALMDAEESLHFEERIAWLEKGIAAAEKTENDAAMQKFIAGMNQFDV